MKIAFKIDLMLSNMAKSFIDDVPNYVFLIDMIFNFNTGYYSKGIIQTLNQNVEHSVTFGKDANDLPMLRMSENIKKNVLDLKLLKMLLNLKKSKL